MRLSLFVAPLAVVSLAACEDITAENGRGPVVTVALSDTTPPTSYSSEDELRAPEDCARMRANRPDRQRIILSANDPGGLARLRIDAFPANIVLLEASPPMETDLFRQPSGRTFLTMTPPATPAGTGFVSALVTLELHPSPAGSTVVLNAEARDLAGNISFTPVFTLIGDDNAGINCRGDQ